MGGFHPYQAVLRQQLEQRQGGVELVLLEAAYKDDSLKCESLHRSEDNKVCSGEVTHILWACDVQGARVCRKQYEFNVRHIHVIHAPCKRPASDCWTIRPI